MSIFSRPPHTITVYPVADTDDGYGGKIPGEGEPVQVRCLVAPLVTSQQESEDSASLGWGSEAEYQIIAKQFPGGPWSRVTWRDINWIVVGEPRRFSGSRATSYDVAAIRKR